MAVSKYETSKDVFVSYGREDEVKKFVRKLKKDLESAQLSVWLDEEDIPAGTEWPRVIGIALSECKALIAVLTKKYVSSRFCKSELYVACTNQKPIFPVIREEGWDVSVDKECEGVKYVTAASNWVSFLPTDDYGSAIQRLIAGLKGRLGRPLLRQVDDLKKQAAPLPPSDSLTGQPPTPNIEPPHQSWAQPTPPTEHLGGRKPTPEMAPPTSQKPKRMPQQCRQFVRLIGKLSNVLSKDPASDALVLGRMKLSIATLKGQDETISIEPEVYRGAQTVTDFFMVMAKYWNCYDDHDLLEMVIESTENEEAMKILNDFLQNRDRGVIMPTEKCPEAPFQSPCQGSSRPTELKTGASSEVPKGGNRLGGSPQLTTGRQLRKFAISPQNEKACELSNLSQDCLPQEKVYKFQDTDRACKLGDSEKTCKFEDGDKACKVEDSEKTCKFDDEEKVCKVEDGEKSKENACQVQIPSEQPTSSQSSSTQQQCADTDLIPQSDKDAEKVVITIDEPVTHQPKQSSTPNPESNECFHFHPGCCNKLPPNRASLIAKVDCQQMASWMYSCVKNVVATVTGAPKPAMSLHGVYEGSCIIVWHVSKEIAAVIKKIQLSLDDQEMLLQCAILSLSCDDKCLFEIAREELQEMVTSGIIPEFAEEIVEVAEGGEMVAESQGRVRIITSDGEFERELRQAEETLVVVDFTADWCGWSVIMDPIFAVLSEQFTEAEFLQVDSEECRGAVVKYGLDAYPTFAFFRKAKLLHKFSGANSERLVLTIKHFLEGKGAYFPGKGHSLGTQKDPDTAGTSSSPSSSPSPSLSPSTSLTSPAAKEKLSGREEGVREGRKQSEQERMREERRRTGEETRCSQEPESKGGVRTITSDKEFERELTRAGKTLVVVDFTSDRCPWSEFIDPVFEVLSERYTAARFLLVDADKCKAAVTRCEVDAVPMFMFFRKKKVLYQFRGATPERLVAAIKYFLQGKGAEKGPSGEEEERQISGEERMKERPIERRSAGEEEKGGDEGAVGGGDREESEEQPIIPDPVTVDPSLPTTMVQIRLADGSRLKEKFNHTHTIGDLHRFISYSRPDLAATSYVLMTTHPRRELTDDTQTLSDANLLNALIIQRKT